MIEKILRKRILWILLGLAALGTGLIVAIPLGVEYGLKRYLLSQGVDQVEVENVDFNPFTRRLVIKNLAVEVSNDTLLNVSEAGLTLSGSSFFKKRFFLENVDLNDFTITIEELPDGRWRIGGLLVPISSEKSTPSSWGFGLGKLQIRNSLLKLRSAQLTSEFKVKQARLTRLRSWQSNQDAHLELEGQLNKGQLKFQGDLSPFGKETIIDGTLKVQELALDPLAQLIAPAPNSLQGQLDADLRLRSTYSSKKGFNFSPSGRLALKQVHMRFGDVDLSDEDIRWEGKLQIKLPNASDELYVSAAGQLEGKAGAVNPTSDPVAFQHDGITWDGKFIMAQKPETADFTIEGELKAREFKMATADLNLAEEDLNWSGSVQISVPRSAETALVSVIGQMRGKNSNLDLNSEIFKIRNSGLDWDGKFVLGRDQDSTDFNIDGALKVDALEMITANVRLAENNLAWNGSIKFLMPENSENQRLTARGQLISEGESVNFSSPKLNFEHKGLRWDGQLDFGLINFPTDLAAEGNFSISDLAIADREKKLTLMATKAINLESIKGVADAQFSVAAAKISGLHLVGQSETVKNASLLSASEVQIDRLILEKLKKLSVQSVRIVDAKGVFHQTGDGRWLYISDLEAFLADAEGAPKRPLSSGSAESDQRRNNKADVPVDVQIGSLEIIGDSELQFEDDTVNPEFRTRMRLKKALLTDVDSDQPETASPFSLEGLSRKYTDLNLKGTVQPFGERISMDLKGRIRAAEMPPLSPYAVKTIGYELISGEVDADIDIKIRTGQMAGEIDLKFYNPIVAAVSPEKLQNRQGKPIPLQSALKVLRDKHGDVRMNIPLSGDIADPQFSFSDAINQALIKGLTFSTLSYLKYMLGPYGTAIGILEIGVKVGGTFLSGISLKPVEFQPRASDLDATALEYADKVATILKEKKDLRLRLCGWATESDRTGRRDDAVAPDDAQPAKKGSKAGSKIATQKDDGVPLSDAEMLALAEQRANRIEDYLVTQHGIENNTIFICAPEIDKSPEAKPRVDLVF